MWWINSIIQIHRPYPTWSSTIKWSCSYPVCQSTDTLSLRLVWAARFQIPMYIYASHKTQSNETSLSSCDHVTYDVFTVVLLLLYTTWTQTLTRQWLHDFMMKSFECSVLAFASLTPFQFNWLVEVHIIHVLGFMMFLKYCTPLIVVNDSLVFYSPLTFPFKIQRILSGDYVWRYTKCSA